MAFCDKCDKIIEYVFSIEKKWRAVNRGYYHYNELQTGDELITDQGVIYTKQEGKTLPDIKGRILHSTKCESRGSGKSISKCRSCDSPCKWVKTKKGNWLLVDPELIRYGEADEGALLVADDGSTFKVSHSKPSPNLSGRVAHFATCPNADQWRKRA